MPAETEMEQSMDYFLPSLAGFPPLFPMGEMIIFSQHDQQQGQQVRTPSTPAEVWEGGQGQRPRRGLAWIRRILSLLLLLQIRGPHSLEVEETPATKVGLQELGANSTILYTLQGKENKTALQAGDQLPRMCGL